jgi:DNA-binding CsgD family transcriptional regulator
MERFDHFAAELLERAQTARDLAELRGAVLQRLQTLIGCETTYWGAPPGAASPASVLRTRERDARQAIGRFESRQTRYDYPDASRLARSNGGVLVDTDAFTAIQRDRLPLYAEILRPAGIRTYMGCGVDFRGRDGSFITLSRHSRGAPFRPRDIDRMRSIRGFLGLVEAAFLADEASPVPNDDWLRDEYGLSVRQAQIATLVARGMQNKEIAALLGTSPDTVRKQTICLYAKTRVSGRAALAALIARAGRQPL